MNLKQALYVKTIAETGSLTAAAKQLYISQPSLSQMLRTVEAESGIALFDRSMQPLRLTYAGEKYLEAAESMLLTEERLQKQFREIRNEQAGRLRIGISVSRGVQVLPKLVPAFTSCYPGVALEIYERGSNALETMLSEGKVDLTLAAVEPNHANVCYTLIEKESMGLLAGRGSYLCRNAANGTPVTLLDAKNDFFVCLHKSHSSRLVQDRLFEKYGLKPKILLEVDSLEIGKRVALDAGACFLMPSAYVDHCVAKKQGVFFPLREYDNRRHFYASYRKDVFVPQYMQDFISMVARIIQAERSDV